MSSILSAVAYSRMRCSLSKTGISISVNIGLARLSRLLYLQYEIAPSTIHCFASAVPLGNDGKSRSLSNMRFEKSLITAISDPVFAADTMRLMIPMFSFSGPAGVMDAQLGGSGDLGGPFHFTIFVTIASVPKFATMVTIPPHSMRLW